MNPQQRNKLAMYLAVKAVCDVHLPAWQRSPAFADAYMTFVMQIASLQNPAQVKTQQSHRPQSKVDMKQTMCQAAITIALAIRAQARKTKNQVMAEAMTFSLADLMQAADGDSVRRCRSIHDLAETGLVYLLDQGITAAKLGMLETAIADFEAASEKPQLSFPTKSEPVRLSDAFEAADKTLREGLDELIEQFQFLNAKFVADYQTVRKIADSEAGAGPRKNDAYRPDRSASA